MSESDLLRELKKISKILLLVNATAIERELSRIATTDDRKKIWVLLDGKSSTKVLADKSGRAQRTVQVFLKDAKLAELIDYDGEFARRIVDYVPPSWITLVGGEEAPPTDQSLTKESTMTLDGADAENKIEGAQNG